MHIVNVAEIFHKKHVYGNYGNLDCQVFKQGVQY